MRKAILFIYSLLLTSNIIAQKTNSDTSITIPMAYFQYGYQWPGADMADRFGSNSVLGGGFSVKTHNNWLVGAEYNYMFGNNTKEGLSILDNLLTSEGNVINGDGTPAVVALFERGHIGSVKLGKIIPVSKKNPNSGIFFTLGLGVITHKVRIEVENQSAPQLKGDYKRGYDRLTAGFQLSQAVGYMYFGKRNIANFTLSLEIYEGFCKGQRDYLFDKMEPGNTSRFDLLIGPKLSWMLPFRKRGPQEFYYY